MDIEQLAINSGVIVVEEANTFWTENNAIEVLDRFATNSIKKFLLEASAIMEVAKKHGYEFNHEDCLEIIATLHEGETYEEAVSDYLRAYEA